MPAYHRLSAHDIKMLLKERTARDQRRLFVAEGAKAVKELATTTAPVVVICSSVYAEGKGAELVAQLRTRQIPLERVTPRVFSSMSSVVHGEGIIGVFPQRRATVREMVQGLKGYGVYCERLQDPANMGAIMRTCVCLGADALFLSDESVDVYHPKVVRASAGYLHTIPVQTMPVDELAALKTSERLSVWVSTVQGEPGALRLNELPPLPRRCLLVFGNEGQGVSEKLRSCHDRLFHIPMYAGSESLNINAAIAVTLYAVGTRTS